MILILTGPSGCGKTTQANILINNYKFKCAISYTTREPRLGEINGNDYNFINKQDFENKIKNNFFLEYTLNFENYYGTSFQDIQTLQEKNNVVLCLCKKGFLSAKKTFQNVVGIYLMPPSEKEILKRLNIRKSTIEEIEKRLQHIKTSLEDSQLFEHIIHPTTITQTTSKILQIINF